MFNKVICQTPFTVDVMGRFFQITGDDFCADYSFLATLRALLHRRAGNDSLVFAVRTMYVDTPEEAMEALYASVGACANTLWFFTLQANEQNGDKIMEGLDDVVNGFAARYDGWREAQDLKLFVQSRAGLHARFYISESRKSAVIIAHHFSMRQYHFIQALTPRLLPWYFEEKLTDRELALVQSLTNRLPADYERLLSEFVAEIDVRGFVIRSVIGGFEKKTREAEVQRTEAAIRDLRTKLQQREEQCRRDIQELDRLNVLMSGQIMALENVADDGALLDYFNCNRQLTPVNTSGHNLYFTVNTFLESFDPDVYDTYSKNPASTLFNGYNFREVFAPADVRKRFLDAIFGEDPVFRVHMCANYVLSTLGSASCSSHYDYNSVEFGGSIPNPHIQHFACLGGYRPLIEERLRAGDMIGAIEQCVASAKSINLAEAPTVRYLLTDIFNTNKKCIRLPDGSDVSPVTALEWLNQKGEENA